MQSQHKTPRRGSCRRVGCQAKGVINCSKGVVASFSEDTSSELQSQIFKEFNSLSVVYEKVARTSASPFANGISPCFDPCKRMKRARSADHQCDGGVVCLDGVLNTMAPCAMFAQFAPGVLAQNPSQCRMLCMLLPRCWSGVAPVHQPREPLRGRPRHGRRRRRRWQRGRWRGAIAARCVDSLRCVPQFSSSHQGLAEERVQDKLNHDRIREAGHRSPRMWVCACVCVVNAQAATMLHQSHRQLRTTVIYWVR